MAQEQPVGEVKFTLVVIGRIMFFAGVLLGVLYLVPFISAYSKKMSSRKILDNTAAEKSKIEAPLAIANRRLTILTEARASGSREKARLEQEFAELSAKYDRLDRESGDAEQASAKAQQVMDDKMYWAGLGGALIVAGAVMMIFSKMSDA